MNTLPKAKLDNLVVQNLKDETLVYDLTTNRAFCLNDTAGKIFNACDGETSFAELKEKYQLTDDVIYLALDGLKQENLIQGEYLSPFAGMNRREVIRRVGLASMIALPVISGLIAPSPAEAASGNCATNVCTPAGQNNCAGCTPGTTFTFTCYFAAGCMGTIEDGPYRYTCTNDPTAAVSTFSCRRT